MANINQLEINGVTYDIEDAGARADVAELKSAFNNYQTYSVGQKNLIDFATWVENYSINDQGQEVYNTAAHYTNLLDVSGYTQLKIMFVSHNASVNMARIHGYNSNGEWNEKIASITIGANQSVNTTISIGNNANIRISIGKLVDVIYLGEEEALSAKLNDLATQVGDKFYKYTPAQWLSGYIKTNVAVGASVNVAVIASSSFYCSIVQVNVGDTFVLTASGGSDPQAYAFTDANYKLLSKSGSSHASSNEIIIAPANGYLIANSNNTVDYSLNRRQELTVHQVVDELTDTIDDMTEDIYRPANKAISFSSGYIKTNIAVGNVVTLTPNASTTVSYALVPVLAGEKYELTATGGNEARAYAFTDTNGVMLSLASANYTANQLVLTAESDGYLIANAIISSDYYLVKIESQSAIDAVNNTRIVNVKDCGAVGDGLTDDTDAIQYALRSSENATLIIPPGTYIFSRTLTVRTGTHIVGYGAVSKLKLANNNTLSRYTWRNGSRKTMMLVPQTTNGCILENFSFEGQTASFDDTSIDGITLCGSNHFVKGLNISNINYFPDSFVGRASDSPGMGLFIIYASNSVIENCEVKNCGYEAIGTEQANNIIIIGCKVGDTNQTGIQIHRLSTNIHVCKNTVEYSEGQTNGAITLHSDEGYEMSDIFIENNSFDGSLAGIAGFEKNIYISNNFINGTISQKNPVYAQNWFIRGNRLNGGIILRCDGIIATDNMLNVNTGYFMINIRGYKRGVSGNVALGSVDGVRTIDREDGE